MTNHKLAMGWSAWLDMYNDVMRKKRPLKAAASRLTKPKLRTLLHADDWDAEIAEKERIRANRMTKSLEERLQDRPEACNGKPVP